MNPATWSELVTALAGLVTAAALVAAGAVLVASRRPQLALAVLLDLLLAVGLLRLALPPSWRSLAAAAAVVALRRLIGVGLRAGRTAHATSAGP